MLDEKPNKKENEEGKDGRERERDEAEWKV